MVPFWGTPRGCPSFLSPRCRHPPQPYTTNAAFRDLWNHAAVARRRDADAPAVTAALPGCCGVFLPGDCAPFRWAVRGGPASTSPRWPLAELATQLRTVPTMPPCPRLSPHAAVATRSSPRASLLPRWALVIIFLLYSVSWESRALLAAAPCGHFLGELLGEPSPSSYLYLVCCCWACLAYAFMLGWSRNSHFKISRNPKFDENIVNFAKFRENETIQFRKIFAKFCEIISRNQK